MGGKAPALISSYKSVTNLSTKFLFEIKADATNASLRDQPGSSGSATGIISPPSGSPSTRSSRRPRFLSPRECARCMGFPDVFSWDPNDVPAFYRQIGNAACPPVIRAIAEEMLSELGY